MLIKVWLLVGTFFMHFIQLFVTHHPLKLGFKVRIRLRLAI